jgi:Antitoxin FitA-like, ribbon-helix-helix
MHKCMHTPFMAGKEKVDLQIRGVPARLQRRIRAKAARKGVSMSKYVIQLLEDNIDEPDSINDWLDEVTSLPPVSGYTPGMGAAAVRRIRDAIDRA